MFDLSRFLELNSQGGNYWQCPECNKRSVIFVKDPLQEALIAAISKYNLQEVSLKILPDGTVLASSKRLELRQRSY